MAALNKWYPATKPMDVAMPLTATRPQFDHAWQVAHTTTTEDFIFPNLAVSLISVFLAPCPPQPLPSSAPPPLADPHYLLVPTAYEICPA